MSKNTNLVAKAGEFAGLDLPPITEKTLGEWRAALQQPIIYNKWANAFVNKISLTHIQQKKFNNPLSKFIKDMDFGAIIEEVFVDEIKRLDWGTYPPANNLANMYEVSPPPIEVAYHMMNVETQFALTISHKDINKAFSSMNALDETIQALFTRMDMDAQTYLYELTKAQLDYSVAKNYMYRVGVGKIGSRTQEEYAKAIAKQLRLMARKLTFPKRYYNPLNVKTVSQISDQVVLISPELESELDVEVLAYAMHRENVGITSDDVIVVDGWEGEEVLACLVDREFFKCYLRTYVTTDVTNSRYMYENNFLNIDGVFSMSLFANQVCITNEETEIVSAVTSIEVSPSEVTLSKGSSFYIVNNLEVTGNASQRVIYSLTGNTDVNTVVTEQGLLSIGLFEDAETLIVTCTAVGDESKKSTCTVTIRKKASTMSGKKQSDVIVKDINLSKMSVAQLDELANKIGVTVTGIKDVKIDTIVAYITENEIDLSTLELIK